MPRLTTHKVNIKEKSVGANCVRPKRQFDHHKYNINSTQIPDFIPIHNCVLFIINYPFFIILITAIIYWAHAMRPYGKFCLINYCCREIWRRSLIQKSLINCIVNRRSFESILLGWKLAQTLLVCTQ